MDDEKFQDINEKPFFIKVKLYLKSLKPIILSHHPKCENFKDHTLNIGSRKFCIGCFVGYPSAIIGFLFLWIISLFFTLNPNSILISAMILLSTLLLSFLNLTKKKVVKVAQKASLGIGSSFLLFWILLLSISIIIKIISFLFVLSSLIFIFNVYHTFGFYTTCKKCKYSSNLKVCPGFKEINEYIEQNNLPNPFKNLKL